jgi:hypothetical protein
MDQSFSIDQSPIVTDAGAWAWDLLEVKDCSDLEREDFELEFSKLSATGFRRSWMHWPL